MRLRRNAIAFAVASAMTVASVPAIVPAASAATAATATDASGSSNQGTQSSTADEFGAKASSDLGSSKGQTADQWWAGLHPVLKFMVGVAAASSITVLFGMLRTLFFNIAGV